MNLRTLLFFLLLINSGISFLQAQDLSSLSDMVSEKDKKPVEKALAGIADAGELSRQANDYYNDAYALQTNYELDEKTLQKKLSEAEGKAIALQIKADKLYSSSYKSLHEICKRNLGGSTVSYGETATFEGPADEMMAQAEEKRKEAGNKQNVYEKAALLNEASALEGAAIDNLVQALQVQSGITPAIPWQEPANPAVEEYTQPSYTPVADESPEEITSYDYSPNVYQKSENLAVDQSMIDDYNAYKNDNSVPDPIMVNRDGVYGMEDESIDHARDIFAASHAPGSVYYPASDQYQTPEEQSAVGETLADVVPEEKEYDDGRMVTTEPEKTPISRKDYSQGATQYTEPARDTDSRILMDVSSAQQVEGVNFMVQVAASRIYLTRSQLSAIYAGNKTVQVDEDKGWIKYRITGFRLFSEANKTAVESGVRDAYVVAYYNNSRVSLPEAREMTRVLEADVNRHGRGAIKNGTDFYVQVAASRIRLTTDKLLQLCGGNVCREVIEEGWFKYQIYSGTSYDNARVLKDQMGGDAFVVAYERGKKSELHKAINKNK